MNPLRKLKTLLLVSIVVVVLGFLLLIYMITVEDEPSPIPPILIVAGLAWAFRIQSRIRAQRY